MLSPRNGLQLSLEEKIYNVKISKLISYQSLCCRSFRASSTSLVFMVYYFFDTPFSYKNSRFLFTAILLSLNEYWNIKMIQYLKRFFANCWQFYLQVTPRNTYVWNVSALKVRTRMRLTRKWHYGMLVNFEYWIL